MATGRPKASAAAKGSCARRHLEPVLRLVDFAAGQGVVRVFQVDDAGDELAAQGQPHVFLGQLDGNGEAAFLPRRGVEPIDDLDGGKDFQTFAAFSRECW